MIARCIVFDKVKSVTFGELEMPAPGPGQILTETIYTGVSTGTESRVLLGGESNDFPLIPGYENIGRVIEVGPGVTYKEGELVFVGPPEFTGQYSKCWGGQVSIALADAAKVVPLPQNIDPLAGLYVKVGGIALHGINRAKVTDKDTVAIVGMGLIGHMAAQSAKAKGAKVIAVDMDADRLEVIQKAGIDHVINAAEGNVEARVKELSNGGVDVAIDVTGIAATVDKTAQLVYSKPWDPPFPPSPRVVTLGTYTQPVCFSYHPTLFTNEPDIITARDTTLEDMTEMAQLIADGKVKPELVPATIAGMDQAPAAYRDLLDKKMMRLIFKW